jgi:hypothetical protein
MIINLLVIRSCECEIQYHKSCKTRHLHSKVHLQGFQKKQETDLPKEKEIEINDENYYYYIYI